MRIINLIFSYLIVWGGYALRVMREAVLRGTLVALRLNLILPYLIVKQASVSFLCLL